MNYSVSIILATVFVTGSSGLFHWNAFKTMFNKSYENDTEEELRLGTFLLNLEHISNHNQRYLDGLETYKMDLNRFADMTEDEFRNYLTVQGNSHFRTVSRKMKRKNEWTEPIPQSVDWRKVDAVSPVKDQGHCGSCWAFSVTGMLESANFLKTKKPILLSEQNLIDCSGFYGNDGCDGGNVQAAIEYVIDNGLSLEETYPYTGNNAQCIHPTPTDNIPKILGYVSIISGNETDLQAAVAFVGPVAASFDARHIRFYSGGIFSSKQCISDPDLLNHALLVVGYDEEDGQQYWVIKNSWGTEWGEGGYMRVAKYDDNMCGVASDAIYPVFDE